MPAPPAAQVIDAAGAFLMPGMTEAHTHFSWNDQPTLAAIQMMPPEEHILWCMRVAKRYLDMGWTSCVGAATAKPRLDVVIRNAIESGQIPGPRYLAASQEITVPGGLGDDVVAATDREGQSVPAQRLTGAVSGVGAERDVGGRVVAVLVHRVRTVEGQRGREPDVDNLDRGDAWHGQAPHEQG